MRVRRLLIAVLVWTVGAVPLLAEERDPSDFVRVLEEGPREEWNVAARRTEISADVNVEQRPQYSLAAALIAAGVLGIFILLWSFRMLQLQRLLHHLAPASARTVALGLTSLRGEVQPYKGKLVVHPVTEEACVYYAGAERQQRDLRFWLVDDTGRVLVDPQGVVLISEDQTLMPGESVHILGTAERMSKDGTAQIVVGRGTGERMVVERLLLLPVRLLFGVLGASERIAATLFSRPEASFWIWDDLHEAPMTLQRDLTLVFVSMLAAAGWITLFVAAAIAVLE